MSWQSPFFHICYMGLFYFVWLHPLIHTLLPFFSRLTFSSLISNALLHFKNLFSRPFIVSLISTKLSAYKTTFIKLSFAFPVTTSIANNCKQQRWQKRFLMYANRYRKFIWEFRSNFNLSNFCLGQGCTIFSLLLAAKHFINALTAATS